MAKTKSVPYDSAEFLETVEDVVAYLNEAFADGDPSLIAHALGVAARARGMTEIANDTQLSRESLYKALSSSGNPQLATVLKIMSALGLRLAVAQEEEPA